MATTTAAVPGAPRTRTRLLEDERWLAFFLLMPTIVLLALFIAYPFMKGILLSVTNTRVGVPGEFVGLVVYTSQGKPIATTNRILLGNYNPDWLAGISNTFTFKGLSLGVLFDMRMGGQVYSHTQTVGREGGIISETLEGRANGYDLNVEGIWLTQNYSNQFASEINRSGIDGLIPALNTKK